MKQRDDDIGIFRRAQVDDLTGTSNSTRSRMIERGEFPAPILIAPRIIGWKRADIRAWLDSRPLAALKPVTPRKAKSLGAAKKGRA